MVATKGFPPGTFGGFTLGTPAPTARMHACGGLMTAENDVIPNIPKFETEKDPPWNSSGFSLPSLARVAKSFTTALMLPRPR